METKFAWQSWVVLALGAANGAIIAILGNVAILNLADKPWLTVILLPMVGVLLVGASNQLKAVGSDTPPAKPAQAEKPPQ